MKLSQVEKIKTSPPVINELKANEVYVFGSNLEGRHGAGSAVTALKWGAVMNQGEGISGKTYAIPTNRFGRIRTGKHIPLTLLEIGNYISKFIQFAKEHPEKEFLLTKVGCGIAGYSVAEIAFLFKEVPENVRLPKEFIEHLTSIA